MKKILLVLITLVVTGCSSVPNVNTHMTALKNFTYKPDVSDEWIVYDRIDQPFTGDCEDYALTLQRQIGGKVWHVVIPSGEHHAVLVADGHVYDNLNRWPVTREEYRAEWVWVMR